MSSIFSRSSSSTRKAESKRSAKEHRKSHARKPVFSFSESKDVVTETALEITRQMLLNPNVNTERFFKSARDSHLEINMSDTTLLVSAAVLDHIGNQKAADRCLAQSKTIYNMYERMGLNNESIRSMFVTAMFCLNPFLVKMIESALRVSINRLSKDTNAMDSGDKLIRAIRRLSDEGTISSEESKSVLQENKKLLTPKIQSQLSFSKTPTEMIGPDDSASKANYDYESDVESSKIRNEADLHRYLRRTKPKDRMNFSRDYPKERKPVIVTPKNDKSGIDYNISREASVNMASLMSEILAERRAGSNVPITPSSKVQTSSDESSVERDRLRNTRKLSDELEIPDVRSDVTVRKQPMGGFNANLDPSLIAGMNEMMAQFEVASFNDDPKADEGNDSDDLLNDLF